MEILQGIDLLKVERVKKIYLSYEEKFLKKILTDLEIKQIKKNQKIYYKIAGKFLINTTGTSLVYNLDGLLTAGETVMVEIDPSSSSGADTLINVNIYTNQCFHSLERVINRRSQTAM